ncbi:MAG: hypothetical protein JJU11_16155 [Candidatus Sumerlaeia bacterium]|nr:hypothetical protein [Candidatus Sumerlaeia bacterium]
MNVDSAKVRTGIISTVKRGWAVVFEHASFPARVLFAVCLLINLMSLPFGRFGEHPAVGLLAPLTVDSGLLLRQAPGLDFFSIHDAGARLLRGGDPYTTEQPLAVRAPYATDFRYPPVTLFWLAVPLNILPPWIAFALWTVVLYLAAWLLYFYTVGRKPSMMVPLTLFWLASFPLIAERHLGQFSFFLGILLFLGIEGFLRGDRRWMWCWMPAMWLKLFPLAMAPSLFFWGWRRMVPLALAVLFGATIGWHFLADGNYGTALATRDLGASLLGVMEPPYAGRQGVTALVNTIFWKLSGHPMGVEYGWQELPHWFDPVYFFSLLIATVYAAFIAWVIWETRRQFSLAALGLMWIGWFLVVNDCWEHHFTALIPLMALLMLHGYLDVRRAVILWVLLGGPSLWYLWQRLGYTGTPAAEIVGVLYFFQRPLGLLLLLWVLLGGLERDLTRSFNPVRVLRGRPRRGPGNARSRA